MKLIVDDVFYFSNGLTVFSFLDEGLPEYIKKGNFHLLKDGEIVEDIWIEGEDLIKRMKPSPYRSVSTKQSSVYKKYNFHDGIWTLESFDEQLK